MKKRIVIGLGILILAGACQLPGGLLASPTATAIPTEIPVANSDTVSVSYEGYHQEIDRTGSVGIAIGSPDAPVTVTEYADFSCPHCFNMYPTVQQIIAEYATDGRVRVVLKPIAFVNPPYSTYAAQATLCAAEQGKGWEMVDQVWDVGSENGPGGYTQAAFEERADALGLDVAAFSTCYTSSQTEADVQAIIDDALQSGIDGVPALFVNKKSVPLAEDMYDALVKEIEAALGN
jgi:protein-disulfide isomerase